MSGRHAASLAPGQSSAAAASSGAAGRPAVAYRRAPRVPLVAHIIYRLDVGGLENGLVNLINHTPVDRYQHTVICLTEYTDFRFRIRRKDVEYYALHKRPGKDFGAYVQLWHLLRRLRPDLIHTRNLATLDCLVPAALAGVRCRVHGEHGRDMIDLDGNTPRYRILRRLLRPLAHRYIPLSRDLEQWLVDSVGVPEQRIARIYNGVDVDRFHPARDGRARLPASGFAPPEAIVIGTVGRLQEVKDPLNLVRAFAHLRSLLAAPVFERLRLALVGDGPLRRQVAALVTAEKLDAQVWMAGSRDDVPELMRAIDVFVLPSLAEGISNTVLEAMASGLPVVATRVGGNPELVAEDETGYLVPPADPAALAGAIRKYVDDPAAARRHGRAGRARVEREFGLPAMVERYLAVYDQVLAGRAASSGS